MKRVCFVMTSPFAVNGFLLEHLRVLADSYALTLCVNMLEYPLSERLDSRVRVVHLEMRRKVSPWADLRALVFLMRFFVRERFDVVHSLMPKSGLLAMLAARLIGVPHRIHTFTGQVWATRHGVARLGLKIFDRMIAACATVVMADSRSQARFIEAEGVVGRRVVRVAGEGSICGVDPARFMPSPTQRCAVREELCIPENAVVFLFLGRVTREKGVTDLVRAFVRLADTEPACWLVVAGPDEAGLEAELRELAAPCAGRFRDLPRVVSAESFLAASDVLVIPSYREGFGMVVVEAACAGLPSIASRIYGLTDAVVEGRTGLLYDCGDVAGLASAMQTLLQDPVLRGQLGEQARERAHRDFSAQKVTGAWREMYRELLGA